MRNLLAEYKRRGLLLFPLLYLVFYMTDAASGYFMIYLKSIGYNTLQMGLLTSLAALAAIAFQPVLGRIADGAPTRNAVLAALLLASVLLCLALQLSTRFIFMLLVYSCFLMSRNTQHPLMDSITLERCEKTGSDFGPIRIMGCVGYALMAVIAGRAADARTSYPFYLYGLAALLTMSVVCFLPKSSGMRQRKAKASLSAIFANRELLIYTLFAMVMTCSSTFYYNYFSIYYTSDLGGSASLYGVVLSIAAFMEIPVIFAIDRLIRRLGTRRVILYAGLLETVRWGMTALVTDPVVQILVQAILGANNMTLSLCMVIFVNSVMPPDRKTTGQTTYTMCVSIGSLLLGSLLGGAASNRLGIRPVFLICVLVNAAALCGFWVKTRRRADIPPAKPCP